MLKECFKGLYMCMEREKFYQRNEFYACREIIGRECKIETYSCKREHEEWKKLSIMKREKSEWVKTKRM